MVLSLGKVRKRADVDADADDGIDDPAYDADGGPFLLFLPPQRDR